nr:helix-turn-helix transcriptional regulator [uncultured Oscillibacter sp.]
MTFGEKLQKLRAREGLSQDALAELLNVSRQAVSRWERDETMPETEKVVRISDHFHVTTDYLLKDGPEHFPPASRPLPDPGDVWRKYGFLLAWALALWGAILCLRMLPVAAIAFGIDNRLAAVYMSVVYLLPGASVAAGGALWARRWRRAGRFRRQDLGWALVLGGGLMMLPVCLAGVLDRFLPEGEGPSGSPYSGKLLLIVLALGLLLAFLPSRKRRDKKPE